MNAEIKIIVGLGNPGTSYVKTRHNAGFWFIETLSKKYFGSWNQEKKLFCTTSEIQFDDKKIKLFKPNTFMNLSGQAISTILKYFNTNPNALLIIHDDIDLEVGQIKYKFDGGHGGHNGLRSIIQSIGTKAFHRLRIGVGHPGNSKEVHDYVLKQPNKTHKNIITQAIDSALLQIPEFLKGNYSEAIKQLHTGQ